MQVLKTYISSTNTMSQPMLHVNYPLLQFVDITNFLLSTALFSRFFDSDLNY